MRKPKSNVSMEKIVKMGMAQQCSTILNNWEWLKINGSIPRFAHIAGSCWVDLDRESQDLPAKGRLRRVPDANHQWFSVERHGPWDLTWVFPFEQGKNIHME